MATLKISELSVGDWVQVILNKCDYGEPDTFKAKVLTVVNNSVGVGYDNSGIVMSALVEDLHPIPITAEMLERNGFEEYSKREWGCNDDSPYHTFIHIDTPDETMWFISFPTISNLTWDHPIYNIHELQHLIRLAGVDKEINL